MNKKLWMAFFAIAVIQRLPVVAQPQQVHLSWDRIDPKATENSMAITWADKQQNIGVVKFGLDKQLSGTVSAGRKFSDNTQMYVYKATLTGLKSNTRYFYACGSEKGGWSQQFSFVTGPSIGSNSRMVVGVWGDTQDNEFNEQFQKTASIVQQLQQYPVQFTIHMGDIVDNGSVGPKWNGLFSTTQPVNAYAPFMPVTGNHDVDNDSNHAGFQKPFPVFYEVLNLPGDQINYSFNYGNTHFVAISSGHAKGAESAGNFTFAPGSSEYQWLENDLAKARGDKRTTWVILYMHHPLYSFGWSHVAGWQKRITPLVDKYKVDLCLAGHRHVYERHHAIRGDSILQQDDEHIYKSPNGTVYITNGTAGGSPQGLGGNNMPSMLYTNNVKMYNYAIMSIKGNDIKYDVYNENGERIDYFQLTK